MQIEPFRDLEGWLTDAEALGLYKTARRLKKDSVVVEIGSWQGKSTFCLAKGLRSGIVYAIDPFNGDAGCDSGSSEEYVQKKGARDLEQLFRLNMTRLGVNDKIHLKKGYSRNFHQDFSSIQALFIDGDHSIEGCSNDFHLYADKIVPGGFLLFHDYYANRPDLGPTHVIQQIVMKQKVFEFEGLYDSLWIARKRFSK